MNKVILVGNLTRDPDVRYGQGEEPLVVARFNLAVNRVGAKEGQQQADYLSCVAFGKKAEVAEKYLKQGRQVAIAGRLQTGSYTNKDGVKVYTTDVLVEEIQFCGTNSQNGQQSEQQRQTSSKNSNQSNPLDIPDGIDEELPFN